MSLNSTDSGKAKVWRILDYEVQMFLGISHIRTHLKVEGDNAQLLRNALVESSLLHIRILTDIFLSRGNQPDDINLRLLGFDPNLTEPILAEKLQALNSVYGKAKNQDSKCWIINKRLAHPTTHRTEGYDYSDLFASMDQPLREIIEHIYATVKRQLPFPLEHSIS